MRKVTTLLIAGLFVMAGSVFAQSTTEYVFNPNRTGELTDPFPVYVHNGARGISGPFDMDKDGKKEFLVSQHDASGGAVHVIEASGVNTWELVYSTALIDSSSSSSNARYATAGDLDGDGNWEILYVAGTGYKDPFKMGVYVWEHDGVAGSDNYGTSPATVAQFYDIDGIGESSFVYSQKFVAMDVDGDNQQELLVAANGNSAHDVFYILSVTGNYEMNGFGTTFETWGIEGREAPRTRDIGGGSPYGLIPADLNGDGFMDLSFHSWNNFNFFNWTTNGANSYVPAPDGGNFKASPGDHVSLFGGVAGDIDGDGNDEVFWPNFFTGKTSVLDYSSFENVLTVDASHFAYDAIPLSATGGAAFGDIDGDGLMEIIEGGSSYTIEKLNNNTPSEYIHVAEYLGSGDPKDGSSYQIYNIDTSSPLDTLGFHTVHRDSLGTMTSFHETAQSKQGTTKSSDGDPVFPSGIAFLGDADGDGTTEIALSFQGVDDSLYVYNEVWNADSLRYDRTVASRQANPVRAFVRVISMAGLNVAVEDNTIVLPSDYVLEQNYPNPFNPSTTIRFTLPLDKAVSVSVYDVSGRLVKRVVNNQFYSRGTYEVTWDGTTQAGLQAASGTYLYSLEYGNFRQTKTMVLLK